MSPAQREALLSAITDWAGWLRADLAENEIERMRQGLDDTRLGVDGRHGGGRATLLADRWPALCHRVRRTAARSRSRSRDLA